MPYEKVGKNEPICIADEVPFEIPDSWEWVRLGKIISIFGRIGFRGYTKNDMVDKGKGAITISPSNIKGMDTNFTDNSYISWEKYEESPEIMIFEDDLLLVKTGSSYGKCGIVKNLPEKATINPQLVVLKYILINRMYLLYVLNSPIARKQYEEFVIGTSIPTFSQEKLSSLLIPLPPLEEQERITCKIQDLNECLTKYDNAENALNNLQYSFPETLKKSILQQAVMGKLVPQDPNDEPASVLLERIRTEKAALIKAGKLKKDKHESIIYRRDNSHYEKRDGKEVCIDDEIPFEIPDSWEWMRLSSFGVFSSGKTPAMSENKNWGGNIPWISSKDMKKQVIEDSEMHITEFAANSMQIYPKGTLLLVARSGILRRLLPLCILGVESTINQDIKAFSLYDRSLSDWLFYAIKAFEPMILHDLVKSVTTVESLKFDEFSDLLIPVPPIKEQMRIIMQIRNFIKLISSIYTDPLFSL